MTQTFCHMRGTECLCQPNECRAAPATAHVRKVNHLDGAITKAMRVIAYVGLAVAFVGIIAAVQIGVGKDQARQKIEQENVKWNR